MKNENSQPTKDVLDAKKRECLHNLWLALRDRYAQKYTVEELNTHDGHLRTAKR